MRATHERWDGERLPGRARSATAIPLPARIIAVCDAYCAMIEDRAHGPMLPCAAALAELRRAPAASSIPRWSSSSARSTRQSSRRSPSPPNASRAEGQARSTAVLTRWPHGARARNRRILLAGPPTRCWRLELMGQVAGARPFPWRHIRSRDPRRNLDQQPVAHRRHSAGAFFVLLLPLVAYFLFSHQPTKNRQSPEA